VRRRPSFLDDEAAGGRSSDDEEGVAVKSTKRIISCPFTINNYSTAELSALKAFENEDVRAKHNVRFICFGLEVAPETGTPHVQGYIRFVAKRPKTLQAIHRNVPGMSRAACIINQRGNDVENRDYCKKPHESGDKEEGITSTSKLK